MMDNLTAPDGSSLCWRDCMEMQHTLTYYGFKIDDVDNIWYMNDIGTMRSVIKMNTELKRRFAR